MYLKRKTTVSPSNVSGAWRDKMHTLSKERERTGGSAEEEGDGEGGASFF
jgi:hypothetical protein